MSATVIFIPQPIESISAYHMPVGSIGRLLNSDAYFGNTVLRTVNGLINLDYTEMMWTEDRLKIIMVRPYPPGTKIEFVSQK